MARNLQTRAEDLFTHFIAPLVLGGELVPGRILGARVALAIGAEQTVTDIDLAAHVELARVRIARKIAPIDRIEQPTADEWALAACLHDIVQSAHPALVGLFRSDANQRILNLVNLALDRIPPPTNAKEALSRHTLFSRALEIGRTDTHVSWWTGSETFYGSEPPPRLTAWPSLRRVQVDRALHSLLDLPRNGSSVDAKFFYETLARWLSLSPLTDLANAHRSSPSFAWTEPTLALVASQVGRTLAVRAMRGSSLPAKIIALEQATSAVETTHEQAGKIARSVIDDLLFYNEMSTRSDHDDDAPEAAT